MVTACGSSSHGSSAPSSADVPFVATPEQIHNVASLNAFRAKSGAAPLVIDGDLSTFAAGGSEVLAGNGQPHAHFIAAGSSLFSKGFCTLAAENQAPDWTVTDLDATVDGALQMMMDEGPGGGHHDNIVNPAYTRVGIGLFIKDGAMYLTNDFSASCN